MRTVIAAASATFLAGSAYAADIPAESRVDAVTVFPAGAEVTRVAKVKVDKGEHVLIFSDVPAQAAPDSIRVEGRATGKLEIGSVDTRRLFVPRSDEQAAASERRKIEDELDRLRDERATLDGQVLAAETQKTLLANLAQLPTRPAPPQVTVGSPSEDWSRILTIIATGTADAQRVAQEAQIKMRDLDRKIEDTEKKLASIAPSREQRTEVKVHVTAGAPLDADVSVRYQVPNASWAAVYDARLATGARNAAPKLDLTRKATITQRTGEAWDNVTMVLSTTRPTAGASAPELYPLTVDYVPEPAKPRPVSRGLVDEDDRRRVGAAGAAQEEKLSDLAAAEAPAAQPAPIAMDAAMNRDAVAVVAPFQALFSVPARLTVPNTGEAKRVQLMQDSIEPSLVVRTVPKDDPKAYLYAKLVLPKGLPVVPGAVSLFRDGTFVGTGQLPVLSPGEDHELGFGVDDSVRVRHAVVEDKRGQSGLISSSKTDTRDYRITVKNMHERALDLVVYDQIPASQNQEIKVERTGTSPTRENIDDKRGVLVWESKLEPDEEEVVEFGYRVTWPAAKAVQYNR